MRAVVADSGALEIVDRPDPVPARGELLVRVQSAGLNGADLLQRAGFYPPPPGSPDILGMELAGIVVATGPDVEGFAIGDRVMAVVGGGAQAEYCIVHERTALAVPPEVGRLEAGGFPEVFATAHDALFTQCGLSAGDRLLVSGAAGGVGVAAVQLAHHAGAEVVASVRTAELRPRVGSLGATVIDSDDAAAHGPYDVVLELVGASNLALVLPRLALGARVAVIGVGGGGSKVELDLLQLMGRRASIRGSTLRARPLEEKAAAARRLAHHALAALGDGTFQVPIEASYPLEDATAAYDRFAAGAKFGKVVLDVAT